MKGQQNSSHINITHKLAWMIELAGGIDCLAPGDCSGLVAVYAGLMRV